MLGNILIKPEELTPSMRRYEGTFYRKSIVNKDISTSPALAEGLKNSYVVEWSDGWAEFSGNEDTLIIYTLFSEKNTKDKFEYVHELAKCLNKKYIVFETERNPNAWVKLINRAAKKIGRKSKAQVKAYILNITVDKGE